MFRWTRLEVVIFDRSWYNRAGVEHVMGFCTDDQYQDFLRDCPVFEKYFTDRGIILIKYWFDVGQEEQSHRFQGRIDDPRKVWKLIPMDVESYKRWYKYSKARDRMLEATDTEHAPVAHRALGQQEACAPQLHFPFAEPDPLSRTTARKGCSG